MRQSLNSKANRAAKRGHESQSEAPMPGWRQYQLDAAHLAKVASQKSTYISGIRLIWNTNSGRSNTKPRCTNVRTHLNCWSKCGPPVAGRRVWLASRRQYFIIASQYIFVGRRLYGFQADALREAANKCMPSRKRKYTTVGGTNLRKGTMFLIVLPGKNWLPCADINSVSAS